jgi:UDP-glucose 4-epimerase
MDTRAFENKNILITGASGFIGHTLANALSVVDCSLTRTSRDKSKLIPLSGLAKITDVQIDYADPLVWSDLTDEVDTIFYLSAQTSSNDANKDPEQDFRHNVLPLLNLLETLRASRSQPTVIFASTATIVGLVEDLPVAENICEKPITVYDIHKLCCEKYLSYYASNGHIHSCSLRLANVYGPGVNSGSADRGILNMMIRRAIQSETLSIFGEGHQIRDYTYVTDVVSAFLAAAARINATNGLHFTIGSGEGHSFIEAFGEIAKCARSVLHHAVQIEHVTAPSDLAPIEARNYVADTTKFFLATGWSAKTNLHSGIQQTLEHYLS